MLSLLLFGLLPLDLILGLSFLALHDSWEVISSLRRVFFFVPRIDHWGRRMLLLLRCGGLARRVHDLPCGKNFSGLLVNRLHLRSLFASGSPQRLHMLMQIRSRFLLLQEMALRVYWDALRREVLEAQHGGRLLRDRKLRMTRTRLREVVLL